MAKNNNLIHDAEQQGTSCRVQTGKSEGDQPVHKVLILTSFEEGSEPKSALPPASELLLSRAEAAQHLLDQGHVSNPEVRPVVQKFQMSPLMRRELAALHKTESEFQHATYSR